MPVTTLEIVDTAVKIGLGAAITGLITYFTSRATHAREVAKEWRKRKREALEMIADQTEGFSHAALKYWALMTDLGAHENRGRTIPEDKVKKVVETKDELFHAYKNLTVVEARLHLLGAVESQKLCREYGELITRLTKTAFLGGPPLTQQAGEQWRADILGCRERFFRSLSKMYVGEDA